MRITRLLLVLLLAGNSIAASHDAETLPPFKDGQAPRNFDQMWAGFDPRAEPLELEVLKEWEEEGVVLKVLRYRIGVFKGKKALMAAVYGFPKTRSKLPGLVQIHGGGQYADHKAYLANAKTWLRDGFDCMGRAHQCSRLRGQQKWRQTILGQQNR
jgi:hypothetical protein